MSDAANKFASSRSKPLAQFAGQTEFWQAAWSRDRCGDGGQICKQPTATAATNRTKSKTMRIQKPKRSISAW
jgi:hypothetical protein